MFAGCKSLTELKIRNFNTNRVGSMGNMFRNCNSFKTLDLSHFQIQRNTDMKYMFSGCSSLRLLILPRSAQGISTWGMLNGCNAQVSYK